MSSLLSAVLLNIIAHLQRLIAFVGGRWHLFFVCYLLELDGDTINPKHNLGGSSALLLAQHPYDGTRFYSTDLIFVILLDLPQDQGKARL